MGKQTTKTKQSAWAPLIINFVIPIFILLKFSDESSLGPVGSLALALSLPIGYELFNLSRRHKPSLMSALAIGGILVTGAVTLLGLSEGWLALRRSIPYAAAGLVLLGSIIIKKPLIKLGLRQILDLDRLHQAAARQRQGQALERLLERTGYLFSGLLIALGIASYALTRWVISAAPSTALFNQEYARLRLLTLPIILLPLILVTTGLLYYLVSKLEQLTGLSTDELMKKKT